jgi:hypothetical protein
MVRNIALAAVSIEIALVVLDFSLNYARPGANSSIRRLFNITREDALASWFATTQTFLIALTLCVITVLVRQGKRSALSRRGWLAVTLFFFYMAVDDGTKLHERVGSALGDLFEKGSTTDSTWISRVVEANPSYNWQLFLMPVFLVAGVAMLLFLWREVTDRRDRALLLLALACFAVAIGLDFVEGLDEDDPRNPYVRLDSWLELDVWAGPRFDKSGFAAVVHFSKSLEEFLEMFGNTLMWVVFLRYLTGIRGELRLRFR